MFELLTWLAFPPLTLAHVGGCHVFYYVVLCHAVSCCILNPSDVPARRRVRAIHPARLPAVAGVGLAANGGAAGDPGQRAPLLPHAHTPAAPTLIQVCLVSENNNAIVAICCCCYCSCCCCFWCCCFWCCCFWCF